MAKRKKPVAETVLGKQKQVVKNRVILVMDASASMKGISEAARQYVNGFIEEVQKQSAAAGQHTTMGVVMFGSTAWVERPVVPVDLMTPFGVYRADNNYTAIWEGFGRALDQCDSHDDVSNLVVVVTDGENNIDGTWTPTLVGQQIAMKQERGNYTFGFMLPPGKKAKFLRQFGMIPADNVQEWEATDQGTQAAESTTRAAYAEYTSGRAKGARATTRFFVTTNAAKVTAASLRRKLKDIQGNFKSIPVTVERQIRELVEEKTRREYVIGSAYYLLMKREKIQADKEVLIMPKDGRQVYGGAAARELIGLPVGSEAMVTPGNHGDYDIYVQSRSVNRKVIRGTKLLVDTTKLSADTPTWDHTRV